LTQDDAFWSVCKICDKYEILMSRERKNFFCTEMLYDPKDNNKHEETKEYFEKNKKGFERLLRFKRWKLLKPFLKKEKTDNSGNKPKSFFSLFNF
jgi:hypothetical protein